MAINIPESDKKRVVIVGAGFAGLQLARGLIKSNFQVVLIDRNNYHQFQPLIYQVATSGLEPSSVSFPLRKIFQKQKHIIVRNAEVESVNAGISEISTSLGNLKYDYLVIATGATSNFFGLTNLKERSFPMKSVGEALNLRNYLLQNFEEIVTETDPEKLEALLNIVIVGGGATGVELSGALAEMKKYILPKDYPEVDFTKMNIYLVEASPKILGTMSEHASETVVKYLVKMGVKIQLDTHVKDFDGNHVFLNTRELIHTHNVIWSAGIIGSLPEGFKPEVILRGNRLEVNEYNFLSGSRNIFAIGDVAKMKIPEYSDGHPQVAQVAIQQAKNLAKNLNNLEAGKPLIPFKYKDKGTMATIGRNRAVADIKGLRLKGFVAWLVWMFVHLMAIVGVKNRLLIFINWFWNYITYDQSLRLIIRPSKNIK
jgi:NADH:ubiquinone reductase (H+-translocating)